jgi:XTP/dITP diphosphohydrolase
MQKIIIASSNKNKIQEITKIIHNLSLNNLNVASIADYTIIEPDEPYADFLSNAIHKAKYYAKATKYITLADDSGLCIDALNGFPGVHTKDFVDECGGIENAFINLQQRLANTQNYTAHFHAAMVLYWPETGKLITNEAQEHGTLTFPARGTDGFAFDSIFIPEEFNKTMAELGLDFKNKNSHRAKALHGLIENARTILL